MQTNSSSFTKMELKRFSYMNGIFILWFILIGLVSAKKETKPLHLKENFHFDQTPLASIHDAQCFTDSLKVELHKTKIKAKKQGVDSPIKKIMSQYVAK